MKIYVNEQEMNWTASTIDYGAVLAIADQPAGASVIYVGPKHGDAQRSGTLHATKGAIVVEDGMRFTAVRTNNA